MLAQPVSRGHSWSRAYVSVLGAVQPRRSQADSGTEGRLSVVFKVKAAMWRGADMEERGRHGGERQTGEERGRCSGEVAHAMVCRGSVNADRGCLGWRWPGLFCTVCCGLNCFTIICVPFSLEQKLGEQIAFTAFPRGLFLECELRCLPTGACAHRVCF